MLVANFLISLAATVCGILVVLWMERQRRPSLSMTIGDTHSTSDTDPLGRAEGTWLTLRIENPSMPTWLSWTGMKEPALSCRAWITFRHFPDQHNVFSNEMHGRWSETPEPRVEIIPINTESVPADTVSNTLNLQPEERITVPESEDDLRVAVGKSSHAGLVAALRLTHIEDFVDIPPGEATLLDVVFRAKHESECYGWNNESYLHMWKTPRWKLDKGRYVVSARVKTGGREFIQSFLLVNDVGYSDFRLAEI